MSEGRETDRPRHMPVRRTGFGWSPSEPLQAPGDGARPSERRAWLRRAAAIEQEVTMTWLRELRG
jgi:hypothetical protein